MRQTTKKSKHGLLTWPRKDRAVHCVYKMLRKLSYCLFSMSIKRSTNTISHMREFYFNNLFLHVREHLWTCPFHLTVYMNVTFFKNILRFQHYPGQSEVRVHCTAATLRPGKIHSIDQGHINRLGETGACGHWSCDSTFHIGEEQLFKHVLLHFVNVLSTAGAMLGICVKLWPLLKEQKWMLSS